MNKRIIRDTLTPDPVNLDEVARKYLRISGAIKKLDDQKGDLAATLVEALGSALVNEKGNHHIDTENHALTLVEGILTTIEVAAWLALAKELRLGEKANACLKVEAARVEALVKGGIVPSDRFKEIAVNTPKKAYPKVTAK